MDQILEVLTQWYLRQLTVPRFQRVYEARMHLHELPHVGSTVLRRAGERPLQRGPHLDKLVQEPVVQGAIQKAVNSVCGAIQSQRITPFI